jgi:hypothetical protein
MSNDPNGPGQDEPTPPQGTSSDSATPPRGKSPAGTPPPVAPVTARRSSLSVIIGAALIVVGVVGLLLTLRSGHGTSPAVEATSAPRSGATTVGHFTSTVRSASGDCRSNTAAQPGRATQSDEQVAMSGDQITIEDGPTSASGPIGKAGDFTARSADGTRSWVGTITGTTGQGKSYLVSGKAADPAHSCTIEFTFTVTLDRALR